MDKHSIPNSVGLISVLVCAGLLGLLLVFLHILDTLIARLTRVQSGETRKQSVAGEGARNVVLQEPGRPNTSQGRALLPPSVPGPRSTT